MGVFEMLDAALDGFFGQWNGYTSALFTIIIGIGSYAMMSMQDPDTHPMLLAKQAVPSTVRNEGESAIYRSHTAPHSMALNAGLSVKDPGVSKWSGGRNGDLRDIWRKAVEGGENGEKGKLMSVFGAENIVEHKLEDITRQINLIGQHIEEQGGIRVAIYLPNSIELIISLFACSFYPNLTTVLIPYNVDPEELISMLRRSAADTVITTPGFFPFDKVVTAHPSLRQLIWVVDEGSSHLDWNEVPEGMGGSVNVATWQDIIRDAPANAGLDLPALDLTKTPRDVVSFWKGKAGEQEEMVRFTQDNLVSGISGQVASIPSKDKFTSKDLFLPADSLTNMHTLILTLSALWQNASVALNSVSTDSLDLELATQGISPTIIVASPRTLKKTLEESMSRLTSPLGKLSHHLSTRTLTQNGVMAPKNALSAFAANARPYIGKAPGKARLLYVAERAGAGSPVLTSQELTDLRILTGARVVYALAAPRVAGAVAQTSFFDYRLLAGRGGHFGGPLSCTELFFRDMGSNKTTDENVAGQIFVRGPCVSGGEAGLGVAGKLEADNTLAYA